MGNLLTLTRPNLANYTYDATNQLISENHLTRGLTTWSYDSAGNRLTAVTGSKVTTWSYDAADQLVSELKSLPGQTPWATAATFIVRQRRLRSQRPPLPRRTAADITDGPPQAPSESGCIGPSRRR